MSAQFVPAFGRSQVSRAASGERLTDTYLRLRDETHGLTAPSWMSYVPPTSRRGTPRPPTIVNAPCVRPTVWATPAGCIRCQRAGGRALARIRR